MASNLVVAVLGAGGSMGSGLARNIARAGLGVRAWNRTRDKAEPLAGDGAVVAGSPAEAAEGADFQLKTKAITERSFEPQFKLRLAAKDASLMEDAMRGHHLDLPLVSAIARQLARGAEKNPDKDMSASYLTSAPA